MKLLAVALALTATQATALSCMRPDPIETFQRLAAAPESYFVISGVLTFDEDDLPEPTGGFDDPPPEPIAGRFVGKGLSQAGFATPYVSDVLLQIGCAGPWCGSAQSGVEGVFFVPAGGAPVTLQAEPCGGMIFYEPAPAVLDMLTSCMQGGTCSPAQFE